ncbi:hypothetical protein D9M68_456370 [compost metagenome]
MNLNHFERQLVHTRRVACHGYERSDGLFDIEAGLADISPAGAHRHVPYLPRGQRDGKSAMAAASARLAEQARRRTSRIFPTHSSPTGSKHEHQRQGIYRRGLRASDPQGARQDRGTAPRRMRQGCAGRRRADAGRGRRLFLRGRRPRPRHHEHGRLSRPEGPPCRLDGDRRLVLSGSRLARRAGHRHGQVQRGAHHPGRPHPLGRPDRHHAAHLERQPARPAL